MAKFPATMFLTVENEGEDEQYHLVHKTAAEALEASEDKRVAEYKLTAVRKGRLIPQFDPPEGA